MSKKGEQDVMKVALAWLSLHTNCFVPPSPTQRAAASLRFLGRGREKNQLMIFITGSSGNEKKKRILAFSWLGD